MDGINQPIKLEPGQFITGRYELHGAYHKWRRGYKKRHPSARTVWRWLKTLEKMQLLTIKSFNKFSIITMSNWPIEQIVKPEVTSSVTNRRPTGDHSEEVINKCKEGGEKKTPTLASNEKICDSCGKPFQPTKPYHPVCDYCYQPGSYGLSGRYNYPKCQGCGMEASSVKDGLCPLCED